jgi:hypothetical protein
MESQTENDSIARPGKSEDAPTLGSFVLLLVTLWSLNLADIFQTMYLKQSGFLASEANYVADFFLKGGGAPFFWAKVLALVLITSILVRGWFDKKGIKVGSARYTTVQVRQSIQFMLVAGIIYYTLIVVFPFVAMTMAGMFVAPEQPPL